MTPSASNATDATLVLDTLQNQRQLGARAMGFHERRLLYCAPRAHIELRLPPRPAPGEPAWLYGQFVDPRPTEGPPGRVSVTLLEASGTSRVVEASESGDFVLPLETAAAFSLECRTPDGTVVRVTCEA